MAMPTEIQCGKSQNRACVTHLGAQLVQVVPVPPVGTDDRRVPFRQWLTDDGTSSGSHDMLVNGATTAREFWVAAQPDGDIYLTSLAVTIADASATLSKFGNLTALTNGLDVEVFSTVVFGTLTIASGLKSNFDVVQAALFNPSFGSGNDSFKAPNVQSTSEAYVPVFDLTKIIPGGIHLRRKTAEKLLIRINDNVSTMDRFDALALGYKVYNGD